MRACKCLMNGHRVNAKHQVSSCALFLDPWTSSRYRIMQAMLPKANALLAFGS
jgi:hypothetical protein